MSAAVSAVPTARTQLNIIAINAWRRADSAFSRRAFVREALAGELTFELLSSPMFQGAIDGAIDKLLLEAREKIAAAVQARKQDRDGASAEPSGGGHVPPDTQWKRAPSATAPENRPGHAEVDAQKARARPAPTLTQQADRHSASMAARAAAVVKLSRLDTFKINGRKLGDVTPAQAAWWLERHSRDGRFVRALIRNLPLDRPIREFVSGDVADQVYAQSEAEA